VAQLVIILKFASEQPNVWHILEACLALAAAIAFVVVSTVEHRKAMRPCTLITAYLLMMLASDVVLTYPGHAEVASTEVRSNTELIAITIFVRLALLVVECQDKSAALLPKYATVSPEETAGVLSRTFFCWLTGLMALGNKQVLHSGDIPRLDTQLRGTKLHGQVLKHWESRGPQTTSTGGSH